MVGITKESKGGVRAQSFLDKREQGSSLFVISCRKEAGFRILTLLHKCWDSEITSSKRARGSTSPPGD